MVVDLTRKNVSCISWAHGINNIQQLLDALESNVDMIEADIVLGFQDNKLDQEPIMAHPPVTHSDLTLERFLMDILSYNNRYKNHMKGIKLDYKSIESFEASFHILNNYLPKMKCPIWLNADILPGPVNQLETAPVNADSFFAGCAHFPEVVLSIGWTTRWGANYKEGAYTEQHINNMLDVIERNDIAAKPNVITFPVRAGIAANSGLIFHDLLKIVNGTNKSSLTIWSSPGDYVDIAKLRELICFLGPEQVYLDLPDSLNNQLSLPDKFSLSSTSYKSNMLMKLSIVIAAVFLAGLWFRR